MLESDCNVPGFALGDVVYIRGRVVAFCKTPWGGGPQIAAMPIDAKGNAVKGPGGEPMTYWVVPQHAVNAETVRAEIRK